jgi:hypothetical protein
VTQTLVSKHIVATRNGLFLSLGLSATPAVFPPNIIRVATPVPIPIAAANFGCSFQRASRSDSTSGSTYPPAASADDDVPKWDKDYG